MKTVITKDEVIEAAARLLLEQMGARAMASLESQIVKKPRKKRAAPTGNVTVLNDLRPKKTKRKYTKRSSYWKKKKKS